MIKTTQNQSVYGFVVYICASVELSVLSESQDHFVVCCHFPMNFDTQTTCVCMVRVQAV